MTIENDYHKLIVTAIRYNIAGSYENTPSIILNVVSTNKVPIAALSCLHVFT
ncbi:hypothetical protein SSCH_430003 [Syntrophaceticus schinkii]|uniref:Uncharacterized protein n=1 Tax=Syntrophaceticus schinkii TaxID=499207 RepID=A0A0B7MM39_9FIRM|nr:hypothetical protein SSCH_430003 [Syntrophaceticus schinkii]